MEIHPACGVLHEKTTLLFRDPVSEENVFTGDLRSSGVTLENAKDSIAGWKLPIGGGRHK